MGYNGLESARGITFKSIPWERDWWVMVSFRSPSGQHNLLVYKVNTCIYILIYFVVLFLDEKFIYFIDQKYLSIKHDSLEIHQLFRSTCLQVVSYNVRCLENYISIDIDVLEITI